MATSFLEGRLVDSAKRTASVVVLLAAGTAAPIACSGTPPSPPANSPTSNSSPPLGGAVSHAIHVFAQGRDGSRRQLDFGEGTEMALHRATTDARRRGLAVPLADSGVPITGGPTIDDPGNAIQETAWELVARAADICQGALAELPPWIEQGALPAPNWYVYKYDQPWLESGLPSNCSARLQLEQNLLCIADKLAEVSDAVGNVIWPAIDLTSFGLNDNSCPSVTYTGGVAPDQSLLDCAFDAEWIIPPQADSDRFIVRDLAIHTLGMIPVLDSYADISDYYNARSGGNKDQYDTCGSAFAGVATGNLIPGFLSGGDVPTNLQIFGVALLNLPTSSPPVFPVFPPSNVPLFDPQDGSNNYATIAASALSIEAQILRSGGRLLHDLVRRDVYSDLAAAAQASAQALDPVSGNQLNWGVTVSPTGGVSTGMSPYGSISHAARVLMGRWEIGDSFDFPTTYQPECSNIAALDLVSGAFGSNLPARVADLPITTPGQARASQLADSAGIVVDSCDIQTAPAGSLRAALVDQLAAQEEQGNGLLGDGGGGNVATQGSPLAAIYQNALANVSDSEIAFAFQRTLNTYLLLTNTMDPSVGTGSDGGTCQPTAVATGSPPQLPAGLQALPPGYVATAVNTVQGIVVSGGIPRSRIHTDPIARSGGMLAASACGEALRQPQTGAEGPFWSDWGIPVNPGPADQIPTPYTLPLVDFQDAFHMGQAFERRLVLLEALANVRAITNAPGTTTAANNSPEAVARGGIAEMRAWAGSTIVHAVSSTGTIGGTLTVEVSGMSNSDLGLAPGAPLTVNAASSIFGFVYGPPWAAECAAHVTSNCPAGFDASYVQPPTGVTPVAGFAQYGVVDSDFQLTVPPLAPVTQGSESHIYMVRRADAASPTGAGHVMGVIRVGYVVECFDTGNGCTPHNFPDTFSFVDAPMQRELVHDALDLGKWVGAAPPALGDQSSAATSGYCVDGVPRDIFVPLDNQLVNGGQSYEDSWQQYLNLAQQAAQTSDTLGQQLIANDLQISENEQTAAEQLAQLCGDVGSLSSVTVGTDGVTTASPVDKTTQTCLKQGTTDVVFLGTPSGYPTNDAGIDGYLRSSVLNCSSADGGAPSPLCNKPGTLTAATLGIVSKTSGQVTNAPPTGCRALLGSNNNNPIAASLPNGFQGSAFLSALHDPTLGAQAIETAAGSLQMSVDLFNAWTVTFGTQLLMSSTNQSYWPACLTNGSCAASTALPSPEIVIGLNNAFRWCPPSSYGSMAPIGCDLVQAGSSLYSAQDAELNALKWRVMNAMWLLAAANGGLPQGMFSLPVPVALVSGSCNYPWPFCYPGQPPTPTSQYGVTGSVNAHSTTLYSYAMSGASPAYGDDPAYIGALYPVAPAFGAFGSSDLPNTEFPDWYISTYQSAAQAYPGSTPLKHTMVQNASVPLGGQV